jgi:tetratricopeptide (TPR) repeat protein
MRPFSKPLAWCALCVFLSAFHGAFRFAGAQTVGASKKRVPVDPAALALQQLLADAQAALDKQDYASAAQSYQDYLAKKPNDATVHYDLGYVYVALKRPADAKAEFEHAVAIDPKMGPAYLNLGLTLLASDPAGAVDPLRHAAELMPDQAQPKFYLGSALQRSGQSGPAIEQYEAAAKLDPKNAEIEIALAEAFLKARRASEAEAAYRDTLALHPEGTAAWQAHLGMARSLIAQKKLDEGAVELAAYLEAKPGDTKARVERAAVLVDLGKDDDALAELDRASAAGPEDLPALKLRAKVYWTKKWYDEAIPVLQQAATLAPQDPNIAALLGHAYLQRKLYPNAIEELSIAYRADPNATDVLADLMGVEYQVKNYSVTLQLLDALAKHSELPPGSWFIRASCYDNLGQAVEALAAYQKFLSLNTDENSDMYFASTERARVLARELKDKKR